MNLKDWEIYQKTKLKSDHAPVSRREESPTRIPEYTEELRKVVQEIEKLPVEDVILATRILKQFLK